MRDITEIRGYHAHVYFDPVTREDAVRLRDALSLRFASATELGRVHEQPVGPHSKPMYQVAFEVEHFAAVVPWLMLNRAGVTILVHPRTGDEVADHVANALWLGDPLPVDVEFLRTQSDA